MKFEGEHLFPGQAGHFFVLLAFVASMVSTISYGVSSILESNSKISNKIIICCILAGGTSLLRFFNLVIFDNAFFYVWFAASTALLIIGLFLIIIKLLSVNQTNPVSWKKLAKAAFFTQLISVLTIFGIIFFICSNHYFEYLYAYKHASKELESKYLLACIWEGQEGSFLLWAIWHSILGTILIVKRNKRESQIMTVISFAQVFLTLMLLGLYFFGVRIGSSPFVFTRNELAGPIFSEPNYLSFIKDGIGLNVLLRNYWMVIHPPILFLGFASTIVPLGFAYSSLSTKNFGDWVKPALPWVLFSGCVLGVGIMMGGKWAYESLSFGGYWGWDPVENAALVPWMILVSGLHCMAVYNATGNALRASYLFIILSYFFVLYSTFLTRTGILGDTSVHSFTEAGMAMNILIGIYVIVITLPMLFLFVKNYKKIPSITKEENISSREFWMFIGSLIFFLAALFIIGVTSIPVYNKVFGTNYADPQDREFTYNKVLVLVAFIVGVLTAFSQYFKYKNTDKRYLIKKIALPLSIAVIISVLMAIFYPVEYTKKGPGFLGAIYLALFASVFSAIANAAYLKTVLKGNVKAGGGAIAHFGFTLMIAGMLISSGNKNVISDNRKTGLFIPFDKDPTGREAENPLENLTLLKDVPTQMGKYMVTYLSDSGALEKNRVFYKIHFQKIDSATKIVKEDFELNPDVYRMKDNNLSSNPGTRHYLSHDVFTYISTTSVKSSAADTLKYTIHEMAPGDTVFSSKGFFVLNGILKNPDNGRFHFKPSDTALVADITVYGRDNNSQQKVYPALTISDQQINYIDDTVAQQNLYLKLAGLANNKKFKIGAKQSETLTDFITLKAYVFPYINLVWAGLLIMACGFVVSIGRRAKAANYITALSVIAVLAGLFYMFLIANN